MSNRGGIWHNQGFRHVSPRVFYNNLEKAAYAHLGQEKDGDIGGNMDKWLLSKEEIEEQCDVWINARSERIISVNRGNYEQLIPIIALAQARHIWERLHQYLCAECLRGKYLAEFEAEVKE